MLAAAIMDMPCYAEEVEPTEHNFAPDDVEKGQELVDEILDLDNEKRDLKAEKRDIYKHVEAQGLVPRIVKKCVKFKMDPQVKTDLEEQTLLFKIYSKVVA